MYGQDVTRWIDSMVELCGPSAVHYCSGSRSEHQKFLDEMVDDGMLIKLNESLRPNSYLARSDPSDVARLEKCTYICTEREENAGPTNNWMTPSTMRNTLTAMMNECMKNKTMYVIPFVMGPLGDKHSLYGIQLTDSKYVVVNMGVMTHMGQDVWNHITTHDVTVVKCFHSVCCSHDGSISTVGTPLSLKWPSNATKYICHFPETLEVISLGSNYGGNSILAKKCVALRIASNLGYHNNWHAEHMMLIGLSHKIPNQSTLQVRSRVVQVKLIWL